MPQWTQTPPDQPTGRNFTLKRTPAGRPLVAVLTSSQIVGCPTHFYKHRTTPCEGEQCTACEEGYSWRWHGYLGAMDTKSGEHFILELTAQACDPLREYRERQGTLRGCLVQATRANARPNGRVCIRTKPADLSTLQLPDQLDVVAVLCHIWDVPRTGAANNGLCKGAPKLKVRHPDHAPTPTAAAGVSSDPGGNGQ